MYRCILYKYLWAICVNSKRQIVNSDDSIFSTNYKATKIFSKMKNKNKKIMHLDVS